MRLILVLALALAASACASREDAYFGKINQTIKEQAK